jgi:hypothetical protein
MEALNVLPVTANLTLEIFGGAAACVGCWPSARMTAAVEAKQYHCIV